MHLRRMRGGASILLVVGALLLSACSGGTSPKAPATSSSSGTHSDSITISNFMFSPMSVVVAPGATVSVTNKDSATHTLTATGGQFNTGEITQNQTKTFHAPMHAGTYHYICDIHQYMMGTITVS
jgi:plastocyanin